MKCILRFIALSSFCLLVMQGFAQSPLETLNDIAGKLTGLTSNRSKLYVYTDKSVYAAGTTIYLKTFLLQYSSNLLYTNPETVYIDLVDQAGAVKTQIVFEPNDKLLEGGIQLPTNINSGVYYLRAYTENQWKRYPSEIFFKPIAVTNKSLFPSSAFECLSYPVTQIPPPGLYFYPEGNSLINGVNNQVIVRQVAQPGFSGITNGMVIDTRDSIVAKFQTNEEGLASFSFVPYKGRKYKCILSNGNRQDTAFLPEAPLTAYQLAMVKNDANGWQFRIGLSDLLYNESAESYLIGVSNGKVCFAANGKGMYMVQVPKEKFSTGLAEFYLFNGKKELVSRRNLVVLKNDRPVQIIPDKKQYFARSTANIDVFASDTTARTIASLVNVIVTDDKYVGEDPFPKMSEYFLLNRLGLPPLKSALSSSTLDCNAIVSSSNLLLPLPDETPITESPNGFYIKGSVQNTKGPIANQALSLMSEQQKSILLFDTTNQEGEFSFGPLKYYDSTHFLLHPDGKTIAVTDWKLEFAAEPGRSNSTSLEKMSCYRNEWFERYVQNFAQNQADTILTGSFKEFIVRGKEPKASSEPTQAGIKRNKFSKFITREQLSKLELSNTVNAVLMIPGVRNISGKIVLRGGTPALDASLDQNIEPLVIVDGVPAPVGTGGVAAYLNSIPPDIIDYIEVLIGGEAASYATRGINGVLIIKTGLPNDRNKFSENVLGFYPRGYHIPPLFKQPNYGNEVIREAGFNDNRSTIFWVSNLLSDEKGKSKFQFYTADKKTTYTVTITGINARGEFIHQTIKLNRE